MTSITQCDGPHEFDATKNMCSFNTGNDGNPTMIRILATLAAATLFAATASAADTLTMPSPADGFPAGWQKTGEATCTPRTGLTLVSSVFLYF